MADENQENKNLEIEETQSTETVEAAENEAVESFEDGKPEELNETDETEEPEESEESEDEPKGPNIFQRLLAKYKAKKKITIPLTVLALLLVVCVWPMSRYAVLGLALKKNLSVVVLDSHTSIPVSGAEVSLGDKVAKTDGEGRATLEKVKVGPNNLKITKTYYDDQSQTITVPLGYQKADIEVKLEANGRQVPIHVVNKISGQGVSGATIKTTTTEAQTDRNGEATIVLPPDEQTVKANLTLGGYNSTDIEISVQESSIKKNTFSLTPSGKIYFLSKRTGNIDVMKSDLDGLNTQTVVKATGEEKEQDTLLIATRDWKYMALKSRREGKEGRFYLINTANDQFTEVDGGNEQTTEFIGWSDHNFIYKIERTNLKEWEPRRFALKSYNADTGVISIIDESKALGSRRGNYATERINNVHILNDRLIYSKNWYTYTAYGNVNMANQRNGIYSTFGNGTDKKSLKDLPATDDFGSIGSIQSEPNEVYFVVYNYRTGKNTFYTYENGEFRDDKEMTDEKYRKPYPTFVRSPSGDKTFWFEERDGKNTLFLGDRGGNQPREIASASELKPYGWFSEDYLLVSKENSELYIMPANGTDKKVEPVKVTNYHRPAYFLTYGGGY